MVPTVNAKKGKIVRAEVTRKIFIENTVNNNSSSFYDLLELTKHAHTY